MDDIAGRPHAGYPTELDLTGSDQRRAQQLLAAVLTKVGPVALSREDYDGADLTLVTWEDSPDADFPTVIAASGDTDLRGALLYSYGYMPVDVDHAPPAFVTYAEDRHGRLLARTDRQWRYVADPAAHWNNWDILWKAVGPLRPLLPTPPAPGWQ